MYSCPTALYVEEFPFHTSNSISPFLSLLKFFICFSHSSRQFTILITVVVNYLSVYFYIGFISESGPVDCLVLGIMFCFFFSPLFLSWVLHFVIESLNVSCWTVEIELQVQGNLYICNLSGFLLLSKWGWCSFQLSISKADVEPENHFDGTSDRFWFITVKR